MNFEGMLINFIPCLWPVFNFSVQVLRDYLGWADTLKSVAKQSFWKKHQICKPLEEHC